MSTESPLVTVIVPSFNHVRYVSEALDSVYDQSYKNIELVIIDDKSTDSSLKVLNRWIANLESKTRFSGIDLSVNDENRGAASSLNQGLKKANGELVTFLNSDDLYDKYRLEKLVDSYCGEDYFCAFGSVNCLTEKSDNVDINLITKVESIPDRLDGKLSNYVALLQENIAVTSGNIIVSKKLAQKLETFETLRYCHDCEFLIRAGKYCEIRFVDNAKYFYRLHGSNSFRDLSNQADNESQFVRAVAESVIPFDGSDSDLTQWDLIRLGFLKSHN